MKYQAKNLHDIYKIMESLPKPIALLDFFCGEVGCEIGAAQSVGGKFYDKYRDKAHIVALCWEGASILYSNVSDDQIEFTDRARSRSGDKKHDGGRKIHWLKEQGHERRINSIPGIIVRCGPYNVSEEAMIERHKLGSGAQWEMIRDRLARTQYIFPATRPIKEPYIALFDRNEQHQSERNTARWQVRLFRHWARRFGFKLVVVSDFYPRQWQDVIPFSFKDRDLSMLCNIIRHSVLYAAPASGSGDAGLAFGCNFVALNVWSKRTRNIMPDALGGRGFRHYGVLNTPGGKTARKIRRHLQSVRPFDVARMKHLDSLGLGLENKTVLEPGCWYGLLTGFWEERSCKVTSTDGWVGNVAAAMARFPHRKVETADLRVPDSHAGMFDVVFLYGTLYHMSRPASVIADLAGNCKDLFLLETCVWPRDDGLVHLKRENPNTNSQAMDGWGCRPARDWVMNELRKHFPHVYVARTQPNHPDFPTRWPAEESPRGLYRAVFVASRRQLSLPTLTTELPMEQKCYGA